ncbi:endolytic transglycosylase MltG [Gottfriedia luciferensis]|uniref:endolytic transglycosylase MltG n=1 Tax=Gottfriedia luciferensis TaxID=178774 RepID=UPI001F35F368|nr:endolytic transglycosylase MltG [Gottfriedia luciferensis]
MNFTDFDKSGFKNSNKKGRGMRIFIYLLIALAVVVGAVFVSYKSMLKPVNSSNKQIKLVTIPVGSSVDDIASIFKEKNLIKNTSIFKLYVKLHNNASLKSGNYHFSETQGVVTIVNHLQVGGKYQVAVKDVMIPEGTQIKEIAAIIAKEFNLDEATVLKQMNDKTFIQGLQKKFPQLLTNEMFKPGIRYPLEGYLYPSTYMYGDFTPSLEQIITPMLNETVKVLDQYKEEMSNLKLTPHQTLTMASLIEEEATGTTDRKLISSVFYNRLKIGMPLQTDPTVLYALGKHKERVLYKDLKVKSPYNTYYIKGLPVGPIASAGVDSIIAALEPAKSDYLYFLADKTGKVIFTKTLEQHNTEKEKHIK